MVHQWLVLWVARKMTADGFVVGGYEGPTPQGGVWNALPVPFEIGHVRPDVWGIAPKSGKLALGEAKSAGDLLSAHTVKQLRVFGRLLQRDSQQLCKLYVGVPRSAAYALDCALARAGLSTEEHVVRMYVPDCLIGEPTAEYA